MSNPTMGTRLWRQPGFCVLIALVVLAGSALAAKSKPKPVRAALETRYAEISEAYGKRDLDAVLRMRRKDFRVVTASGEIWDAEASAGYVRAGFAQVETTLVLTFDIGTIDVHGDTAAAEIDQHWMRRQLKANAIRHVDTHAHQRETWLRSEGQWWLWRIDQVVPGPWVIDGKRVDPRKPYDPNAAAYDTDDTNK
jgi:uncharacterized protein DUF4440